MELILFLLIVLFSGVVFLKKQRTRFDERFPPISDAEYVARCRPKTNVHAALKVRRILSESLGVEYERIYPSSRLIEDLGAE